MTTLSHTITTAAVSSGEEHARIALNLGEPRRLAIVMALSGSSSGIPPSTGTDSGYASMTDGSLGSFCKGSIEGIAIPGSKLWSQKVRLKVFSKPVSEAAENRFADLMEFIPKGLEDYISRARLAVKPYSIILKVLGEDEATAKPWIFIQCDKALTRKIKQFFKQDHIKSEYHPTSNDELQPPFRVFLCERPPRKIGATDIVDVYAQSHFGLALSSAPCCIKVIYPSGSSRIGTLGGLIKITAGDGSFNLYGMTAGHVFASDDFLDDESELYESMDGDIDEDENSSTDDEEIVELDLGALDDDESISCQDEKIETGTEPEDDDMPTVSWTKMGRLQDMSVNTIDNRMNLDWALITIDDPLLYGSIAGTDPIHKMQENGELKEPLELPNQRRSSKAVTLCSSTSGTKEGLLSASWSYLQLSPGKALVRTYTLTLSDHTELRDGDCGAWVVDKMAHELYGHVVASGVFGEAYVVPLESSFENMRLQLRTQSVCLPQPQEVASWLNGELERPLNPESALTLPRDETADSIYRYIVGTAKRVEGEEEPVQEGPPPLPSFLTLTEIEMRDKYAELTRLENERLGLGKSDPQWSRRDPDPVLDRYINIFPWDNNRIKLQVPEGVNDYINASPVSLISTSEKQSDLKAGVQDKYICMQGPKKQTVDHVWHMIWHELAEPYTSSPAIVIMLTPTHAPMPGDPNRMFEKCYQYYPLDENSPPLRINETNQLGEEFKAQVRFEERLPGIEGTAIEVRKLIMTVDGEEDEEKPIYHYLYPDWPDFGALAEENIASILSLMELTRKQNGRGENARLIHCNAGVGRTGTFVALEFLLGELEGGAWEGWDNSEHSVSDPIYETVNQLRMQRKTMVQAYDQYAFLYEVCRKRWEEKYNTPCIGGEHTHMQPMNEVCINGLDEDENAGAGDHRSTRSGTQNLAASLPGGTALQTLTGSLAAMAGPASSSMFTRLANAYRLLSLRSDIDNIILELLGQFSLEKIYCDGDKDTYQNLVITLLAQLNTIFNVQRLSLPSENQQVGWYLGFLTSWEVTLRSIEFVLQVVVEGRESLWEARLLRDKYLPELLLNALRVLILHPKVPSNQKAKDQRDRFARIHRSLERVFDSYPGPESLLLLICKEVTDSLRTEPNGLALPPRMRSELPNLASELYPLPECLSSQYVANIVPQDGFPGNWLAQFMALRDVSHFIVGASVQYAVNRETRDMRLQSSSARTRNAVLHALENIRIPTHLSKVDLVANFSDTFRIILPDTLSLARRGSTEGCADENDIDAIDALCSRLSDRQVVNRVSDREMMHSVTEVTRSVELLDDPGGKSRAARPKVFVLNCEACHIVGESQLKDSSRVIYTPSSRDTAEVLLPPKSRCLVCGDEITMMREVTFARDTWELLKPLESNADTINVERHLPTQFQMNPLKVETGIPFHPGYANMLREGRHQSYEPESSSHPPSHIQIPDPRFADRSRSMPTAFPMSPNSPGLGKRVEVQRADLTPSEELTSSDGANYFDTPETSDPPQRSPSNIGDVISPFSPGLTPQTGSQSRLQSISTMSFDPEPLQKSRTLPSVAPPEKGRSRWRSKLTSSRKESSKTSGDSSSLSSTTPESQKLEEIPLKNLVSSSKISRGKSGKNINVAISQNSSYVLFWTQASINIWDVGASSPILGRAVLTESNCVLAAVTKVHLAYIIGTRDQKLTLRIVNLIQPSVPMIEYRMPSSPWCHSICIDPKENHVVLGFDNSTVRFFNTAKSEEPREERLHIRNNRDCRQCPPIDTLSFSTDGLVLIASTRSPKNGMIQIYAWRFPFEESQELARCRYQVPLHESEDNGVSSAIFRSGVGGEENLICISTWTQSGVPVLVQPQGGHRSEIRSESSTHQGKLGNRIQCAAFSPTGGELALVNDKGHLYHISNLNASPMEVKRIATSRELTTRSDAFAMTFMKFPDEEAIVMAWADSSKAVGYVKKVPVRYSDTLNTPMPMTPATPGFLHSPRYELPSEGREIPKPPLELNVTEVPAPLNIVKGYPKEKS